MYNTSQVSELNSHADRSPGGIEFGSGILKIVMAITVLCLSMFLIP